MYLYMYMSLSHVRLFATPWTTAHQVPLVHGDSPGKNTGVDCHALFRGSSQPRDQIEPRSPALQVDSLPSEPPGKPNIEYTRRKNNFFKPLFVNFFTFILYFLYKRYSKFLYILRQFKKLASIFFTALP